MPLPVSNKLSASRGAGLTCGPFTHFSHFKETCKSGQVDFLQSGWIKAQSRQFCETHNQEGQPFSSGLISHHSVRKLSRQVKSWALQTPGNTPPWKAKTKACTESSHSVCGIYRSPSSVLHSLHMHACIQGGKTSSCPWRVWLLEGDKMYPRGFHIDFLLLLPRAFTEKQTRVLKGILGITLD